MQILLWTTIGFIFAVPRLGGVGHRQNVILSSLAQWWSWGLLSPIVLAIDRRLPFSSDQLKRRVFTHLAISPAAAIIYIYLFHVVMASMGLDTLSHVRGWDLVDYSLHGIFVLWSIMVYLLIVGVRQIDHYRYENTLSELRIERLERSFSQARLDLLRAQLNPHFLFNTLNTISAQTESEPGTARTMIAHLGDMLRASIDSIDRREITLQEELDVLDHYLAIQRLRFGDRLKIQTAVSPDVRRALIPALLLQPLVENAIQHGFSKRPEGGRIEVVAEKSGNHLRLRVVDDGSGLPDAWNPTSSRGLGLALTRERVVGTGVEEKGRFWISRASNGGTEVEITIPLLIQQGAAS
jgi:two-component sensor histidine kinase